MVHDGTSARVSHRVTIKQLIMLYYKKIGRPPGSESNEKFLSKYTEAIRLLKLRFSYRSIAYFEGVSKTTVSKVARKLHEIEKLKKGKTMLDKPSDEQVMCKRGTSKVQAKCKRSKCE